MESIGRHFAAALVATFCMLTIGHAQKLVDPDKVAPEFRDAAMKRRAEQIKIQECRHKAEQTKALPRDRTAFIEHCMDDD